MGVTHFDEGGWLPPGPSIRTAGQRFTGHIAYWSKMPNGTETIHVRTVVQEFDRFMNAVGPSVETDEEVCDG